MSRKRKVSEDEKVVVPMYIVTFANILILLLAFFVLLLTLAEEKTEEQTMELFTAGQNAFRHAISDFGMGRGSGFDYPKAKYKVEEGQDEPGGRSIDAAMETVRRRLLDLEKTMKIMPSQIVGVSKTFTVTDIHFNRGGWVLNKSAKQFLTTYCRQLEESLGVGAVTLYVVGLAVAEASERGQWQVSARRAEAVASFIKVRLGEQSSWSVYSWGAGPGGDWSGPGGVISKQTDIMIVVLSASK